MPQSAPMTNALSLNPDYWRYFAREAAKGGDCPLYELVANAIADDPAMQAVTGAARPGQPPANMLFAAVHDTLLAGADHELRLYYSHLLKDGETVRTPDAGTYAVFGDFVARHRDAIDPLIATRVTNTNEVRRSAYLRAGYAAVAAEAGRPLGIVELGPSAGLNLNWDRYQYEYRLENGGVLKGGPPSALVIDCAVRGAPPPVPADPPAVGSRVGLELNAVDLNAAADRRWLVALLWPGLPERIARMEKALAIATDHPPPVIAGDALANLPGALAAVAEDHAAVVTHSMVTYQWDQTMRDRLEAILLEAGRGRVVWRLFQDTIARDADPAVYLLRLRRYAGGAMEERVLAEVHHHGAWIAWRA
ncbi:MAG: DUF2332 domain-containing protein [Micropepsaceae bacterium]